MSEKLKCVVAGYGYMGEIRRRVIESHPQLDLIGIFDPDQKKREKISGCQTFTSVDEMLRAESEVVFVCTPNRFAPDICIKSMKMGKHIFCEKPPGRNLEDIKRIIEAEKGETKLMFGFNHRFHPGVIKAKIIVDSGRLGKVIALRGIYGKSGGKNFSNSWRNDKRIAGGGILLDQGIHMLDLFRYFCGDFPKVKCFAGNYFWKFDCEDNAAVILQNDSGQTAMLHSSSTLWKHIFRLNIILENGYIIVEGLLSKTGSYGREKIVVGKRQFEDEAEALGNPAEEVTYFDRDLSWEIEIDEFVKCIQKNSQVSISNSEDAFKVMEIIDKCYRDANTESLEVR
jgi:predicted dehydrogenase